MSPLPSNAEYNALRNQFLRYFDSDRDFRDALAFWPVCPDCGRRRQVRCRVCGCQGNFFPPADAEYWDGVTKTPTLFASSDHPNEEPQSLINRDAELQPGVRDWTKPLWTFVEKAENKDETNNDKNQASKTDEVWESLPPSSHSSPNLGTTFSIANRRLSPHQPDIIDLVPALDPDQAEEKRPRLLLCPLCGEPFAPQFLPKCACGHHFS